MATLVFAKQFLDDFAKLEPTVRQKVRELPDKFENVERTGIHLEKLTAAVDDRVRTIRVDQSYRGVVVRMGEGRYALLRVMAHDDANNWAMRQRFGVNPVTGIVEILDVPSVADRVETIDQATPSAPSLFEGRRDRDFESLGVDPHLIPVLRKMIDEAELIAIAHYLPDAQADAVLLLADGKSVEDAWSELQADYGIDPTVAIDPSDLASALDRSASKSGFVVTTTDAEMLELLAGDFQAWRTFLHPTQSQLAYRPVYTGPAKVTGGAGTGKTVVAIHRARYLAQQAIEAGDTHKRILVATYTTSLAENLERTLRTFCSPEEFRFLHISTVDALARQVLTAAGTKVRPIGSEDLVDLAKTAAAMVGLDEFGLDGSFLVTEWEQVVLGKQIRSLPQYAQSPRPGRGRRLSRSARIAVWAGIEQVLSDLSRRHQATFVQIADLAADSLGGRAAPLYAHAVIDEGQDLHPGQWRLIRAAVQSGENDLFIAGDANQRIYDYRVSLSALGIETRGRSRRLKINYRTSQQILLWALPILTGDPVDDLDGGAESRIGYRSVFEGPAPVSQRFLTPSEEAKHVAQVLDEWIENGIPLDAIGVVARTRGALRSVRRALEERGIFSKELGSGGQGVITDTMHSVKGLEFARLAVVGANADQIPLPAAVTPASEDPQQHALDVFRERCLFFVACTRVRDELLVTGSGAPSPFLPS